MSAAALYNKSSLRSAAPRPEPDVAGIAEFAFAWHEGRTRLAHLYQRSPLRVLFPEAGPDDLAQAVLVTTSGGLVGGDALRVELDLGIGARAHVTAAAAEKVYRSLGPTTRVTQILSAAEGAWLEFLPPETILFDGARLSRGTRIEIAAGAGFLGGGITVFGRRARGERFTRGLLHDRWELRCDGRLVWGDALVLDEDIAATIDDPACFDGAAAFATLILVPADMRPRSLLEAARAVVAASGVRGGVTLLDRVLVARWLADDAARLRRAYADLACYLRAAAMGLPPRLPRLWQV